MAKRIKYKIGDLFTIPLENGLLGVGRILINSKRTVFIECYNIKPINDKKEFNYWFASKKAPLVMHWCYDDALVKGEWEIFDYIELEKEIDMPFFWHQDAGDNKYYIQKGSSDSFRTIGERVEISNDEIHKYEPEGIGNQISERNRYLRKLREIGLI